MALAYSVRNCTPGNAVKNVLFGNGKSVNFHAVHDLQDNKRAGANYINALRMHEPKLAQIVH